MDALAISGLQISPEKYFDRILDIRAEKREYLRGRNNVTSCRSPAREINTRQLKNELKEKRHLEFLRRRSVSPEPCERSSRRKSPVFSGKYHSSSYSREAVQTNTQNAKGHPLIALTPNSSTTDDPGSSKWASLWSEQIRVMKQDKSHAKKQTPTSTPSVKESDQHRVKSIHKTDTSVNVQKTTMKTLIQREKIHQKTSVQTESILQKKILRESGVQTESGLVTVKESEIQRLADYLQEALWREDAVKKKLADLQESTTNLVNSSNKIWTNGSASVGARLCQEGLCSLWFGASCFRSSLYCTGRVQAAVLLQEGCATQSLLKILRSLLRLTDAASSPYAPSRCSEDLLRNKIKALEAQLQVCLQKFPKDGVKKLVVQMEKQRMVYEEKALIALQKATQEKTEALSKAETLQEALITAKAEALRWQSLYEELKVSSGHLRESQHLSNEQLQQLHSQVELSRAREHELGEEVLSLRQEKQDLQYNICLLEEDNQTLREEIQHLRDDSNESQDIMMQECLVSQEAEPRLTARRDSQLLEQLRHTQDKLQLKERECEELQTELHAMEQECQSSQARLSQCRDELRQLSHRHRRTTPCGSWRGVCMFFLLLLTVAGVVMLWLWHPPFREQVEDLYSDIETRIEDYLIEMASPRHSGCFRPI